MTAVYAVVLVAGVIGSIAWVIASAVAGSVEGWDRVDPDARFGRTGRWALASALGFAMGGLSASFAGWPAGAAVVAAVGGAVIVVMAASWFGPDRAQTP